MKTGSPFGGRANRHIGDIVRRETMILVAVFSVPPWNLAGVDLFAL